MSSEIETIAPVLNEAPVPPAEPQPRKQAPTFSPEQQEFLDTNLIPKVMGRAASEVRKDLALAQQHLSRLETALKASQPNASEADRLRGELQAAQLEVDALKSSTAEALKAVDLDRIAVKHGFLDAELVRKLVSEKIQRREDGGYNVIDGSGNVRVNAEGEPLTVEAYYEEVAAARPYLVRGQVIPGHGSQPSIGRPIVIEDVSRYFGPNSDGAAANRLPKDVYRRMRIEAVRRGLVA